MDTITKQLADVLREANGIVAAYLHQQDARGDRPGTCARLKASNEKFAKCFANYDAQPLQQARQPLTKVHALMLWGSRSDGPDNHEIITYARVIEAAHGITGEQP